MDVRRLHYLKLLSMIFNGVFTIPLKMWFAPNFSSYIFGLRRAILTTDISIRKIVIIQQLYKINKSLTKI